MHSPLFLPDGRLLFPNPKKRVVNGMAVICPQPKGRDFPDAPALTECIGDDAFN